MASYSLISISSNAHPVHTARRRDYALHFQLSAYPPRVGMQHTQHKRLAGLHNIKYLQALLRRIFLLPHIVLCAEELQPFQCSPSSVMVIAFLVISAQTSSNFSLTLSIRKTAEYDPDFLRKKDI